MPKLAYTVLHDEKMVDLDFHKFGTFSPQDIFKTASYLDDIFEIERLYPAGKLDDDSLIYGMLPDSIK